MDTTTLTVDEVVEEMLRRLPESVSRGLAP
jgi:hypothetical protein